MTKPSFYNAGFPYKNFKEKSMPGKLIVLEGTDGVGRSTQIASLRHWLEDEGYAVSDTGLRRSPLTQPGLDAAKLGHTLSPLTMSLFYATDFTDRLENQIIPALKAGFYVLSDRYFYSTIARDVVRGADEQWVRNVYGFALKPDIIFYLRADVPTLVTRMMNGRGFDYWESGMDIHCADNFFDSFCTYQGELIKQFDLLSKEYGFVTINANRDAKIVFNDLRRQIKAFIAREEN
jgi:dTMP kinase